MREKLIDVFMHLDRHIENRDEYGICYTSDFAEAVETVLEMLKNGVTIQKWIPVTERLPEKYNTEVLVYTDKGCVMTANYEKDYFINTEAWITPVVTHWMPLPEEPKGE